MRHQIDRDVPVHRVITYGKNHSNPQSLRRQHKSKTKTITKIFGLTFDAGPGKPVPRLYDPSDLKNMDQCNPNFENKILHDNFCNHIDYSKTRKPRSLDELDESIEQFGHDEKNDSNTSRKTSEHEVEAVITLSSCFHTEVKNHDKRNFISEGTVESAF